MKKLTSVTVVAVFAAVLLIYSTGFAQCYVKINGVPTVGSPLRAKTLDNNSLQVLIWQLNGVTVFNAYRTDFIKKGVTVAGGKGFGNTASQLAGPSDVYTDAGGNVFVLDGYNNRVQKWAPGATQGTTVAGGNGIGNAPNQLYLPQGFFMDMSGNIFIADLYNNRVQKWTPGATQGVTVAGGNGYGSAANQLNVPHDVYGDASGNIYITDGDNNRIQKWEQEANQGTTIAGGNGPGTSLNQLSSPHGIGMDASGNVYISDRSNNRILKWNVGASSGTIVAGGLDGQDSSRLNDPRGIFVTGNGIVYIADYFNNRIQKWIPGMNYGITVVGNITPGKSANRFSNPSGLFVNATGDLYVADEGNNRVQKFAAANTMNMKFIPGEPGIYRVVAIFANGCRDTSNEIVIVNTPGSNTSNIAPASKQVFASVNMRLTPSPAHTYSDLSFSAKTNETWSIELTDMAGRVLNQFHIKTVEGTNRVRIEVVNYSAGFYLVNLRKNGLQIQSLKLYKQ